MTSTIKDFVSDRMPYIPYTQIYVNSDILSVTISRDGYYLDHNWKAIKSDLAKEMLKYLDIYLSKGQNREIWIANQYIFRNELKEIIQNGVKPKSPVLNRLVREKLFQINGKRDHWSLEDIKKRLSPDTPMFFSEHRYNLRWLGGNFRHDFIVLPGKFEGMDSPFFWDDLFGTIFDDAVNLDTIESETEKLQNLIERKVISGDSLSVNCNIVGEMKLSEKEHRFLDEIHEILKKESVLMAISETLFLPIRRIRPAFIEFENGEAYVSTGLFNEHGIPVDDSPVSNFLDGPEDVHGKRDKIDVLLGMTKNHPFIEHLVSCSNPRRAYYSVTYLAHELALSQKVLVPYTTFFHNIKEKLASRIRQALMQELISDTAA